MDQRSLIITAFMVNYYIDNDRQGSSIPLNVRHFCEIDIVNNR